MQFSFKINKGIFSFYVERKSIFYCSERYSLFSSLCDSPFLSSSLYFFLLPFNSYLYFSFLTTSFSFYLSVMAC